MLPEKRTPSLWQRVRRYHKWVTPYSSHHINTQANQEKKAFPFSFSSHLTFSCYFNFAMSSKFLSLLFAFTLTSPVLSTSIAQQVADLRLAPTAVDRIKLLQDDSDVSRCQIFPAIPYNTHTLCLSLFSTS